MAPFTRASRRTYLDDLRSINRIRAKAQNTFEARARCGWSSRRRSVGELKPDIVGLTIMTFQRRPAIRVIVLVRPLRPQARVVVGGYDPSLAPEAYEAPSPGRADFIVRGEGEMTFRDLVRAMETGGA